MSVAQKPRAASPTPVDPPLHTYRFSVERYDRLVEIGFFTPSDRLELLEGWIVHKMPQDPPHASTIEFTQDALAAVLPEGWRIRDQKPIATVDSRPEPDLAVVRGPARRYQDRHPGPADIALVIEVADTTLDEDRTRKGRIYARARIPVYWIVNLVDNIVEVYTQPKAGKSPAYRHHQDFGRDESLPLVIDGKEIARIPARELLPA